jgi:hypothetical protein
MNTFSWGKAIGFGFLIWAIASLLAAVLAAFGVVISFGWSLMLAVLVGVLSYAFAVSADSATSFQALGYGLVWALMGIGLDLLIMRQFQNNLFENWTYWLGVALVLFAPWFEYEVEGSGHHAKPI